VSVDAPPQSAGQIYVIYRSAPNLDELAKAPWAWDYLDPLARDIRPTADKFYQFAVLCTRGAGVAGFKELTVMSDGKLQRPILN
jgi:hypothetical protein